MNGNWAWNRKQYGLQRMAYTGLIPFEMLSVEAKSYGLAINFTKPVAKLFGNHPNELTMEQWRYVATENYGGPKVDQESVIIDEISFSKSRLQMRLKLRNMKPGRVIYLRLPEDWKSNSGQPLWSGEMWYTMNQIPN